MLLVDKNHSSSARLLLGLSMKSIFSICPRFQSNYLRINGNLWTGKGKTVKFFVVVELPLCRVSLWDGEIYFLLWLDCKCPTCVCALGPQTVALLGEAVHLLGGKTSLEKGCHRGLVLGFKTCPHFSAPSHHAFSSMVDTQTMSLNISLSCFLWIV